MTELTPWPYDWRQTSDTSEDLDRAAENAAFDCGPESYSALIYHVAQVEIAADTLKDSVKGDGYVGYLTCQDVANIGRQYMDVEPQWWSYPTDMQGWLNRIRHEIEAWRPMIGLFSWGYVGAAAGHFQAITGYDSQHVITYDPMYGRQVNSHKVAWDWANGPQGNPLMTQPRRRCIAW
jgi:hypothetical protein